MTKYDYALIVFYLVLVVVVTVLGSPKKRSKTKKWKLFLLNLFLTPIAGVVIYLRNKEPEFKINQFVVIRYKCSRCGYKFDEPNEYCPICQKEGYQVKLDEVKQIMT